MLLYNVYPEANIPRSSSNFEIISVKPVIFSFNCFQKKIIQKLFNAFS